MRTVIRVDQLLVDRHVVIVARHAFRDLVPHDHPMALRIRLRDDGEVFARPIAREIEGEAHDPFDAGPREDRDFEPRLFG